MASVALIHVGNITSISPGATHHIKWNNAPAQRVWAVSVDAMVSLAIPPQLETTTQIQVTAVEYREIFHGGSNFEKEIHFWIKNTGTVSANYAIHMSMVTE